MQLKYIFAFALFLLFGSGAAAPAENAPAQHASLTSKPKLLIGRIENRSRLDPVAPQLRVGASMDVASLGKLKKLSPDNQWARLPDWAAGSFKWKFSSTYYSFTYGMKSEDYSVDTRMAKSGETRGWQKDRFGNIWEYSYKDYYTKTECEDTFSVSLVKDAELLQVSGEKFIMRFVAVRAIVSKYTQRIIATRQTESIQTYTPYAENIVKINGSVKSFDEDGNPLTLEKVLTLEQRILPYQSRDSYRGQNMRALFAEYLVSHGLASSVPPSIKTSR